MITIVITDPPYTESDKAWSAMKLALTLLAYEHKVNIFLTDAAVAIGAKGHQVTEGMANLESLLTEIIEMGANVKSCRTAMSKRNISMDDVLDGVGEGSTAILTGWVIDSDKVLTF